MAHVQKRQRMNKEGTLGAVLPFFGDGDTAAERRAALKSRASLLDSVTEEFRRLNNELGPADRARVAQYLDAVREVERRIQRAEASAAEHPVDVDRPVGVPAAYSDHARLMFDLQVLAFQADVTRVITFQLAREASNRTYTEIGVSDPHHPLSHPRRRAPGVDATGRAPDRRA